MKDVIIKSYSFNLKYANKLVVDIDDDSMTKVPCRGYENHAAFTLGHLASGSALMSKYLGGSYEFSPEWEDLFRRKGPGDPRLPETDLTLFPTKIELLADLQKQHELVEGLLSDLHEDRLEEKTDWRFSDHFPTLGDLILFMCVTHESMHLGQLAGWRRALGYDSALAKL